MHIAIYREQYSIRPLSIEAAKLTFGSIHDDSHGTMHVPLQASLFAEYEPELLQRDAVTERDLHGYRTYLDYHPDGEAGAFSLDREKIN